MSTETANTAAHARESLAAATIESANLRAAQAEPLIAAAREAFTSGLAIAAGAGAVLMLVSALGVWLVLRDARLPGGAEVGVLDDPGVHGDPGGHGGVDAPCGPELGDRHC